MILNPVKASGIDNNLKLDADAIKDAILRMQILKVFLKMIYLQN